MLLCRLLECISKFTRLQPLETSLSLNLMPHSLELLIFISKDKTRIFCIQDCKVYIWLQFLTPFHLPTSTNPQIINKSKELTLTLKSSFNSFIVFILTLTLKSSSNSSPTFTLTLIDASWSHIFAFKTITLEIKSFNRSWSSLSNFFTYIFIWFSVVHHYLCQCQT